MKNTKLLAAIVALPFLVKLASAGIEYSGGINSSVNLTQAAGTTLTTGAGASTAGTPRVILASDSPMGSLGAGTNNIGTVGGSTIAVTGLNSAALASAAAQTTGNSSLSSIDGKITAVNTGAVTISAALPAGGNIIGLVNGSTLAVTNVSGANLNVNVNAALPAGSATIGATNAPTLTTITQSSVTVSNTASVQVFPADSNRKSYEITALPTNTDFSVCKWGGPAVSTDTIILSPGANYVPTHGVQTASFNCIGNSGSQVIRGNSYAP